MLKSEDQLKAWMTAGLDGDASAHAVLLRALVPVLRAYYRRRVHDEAAIEDLVQETLIAIHFRRASYDRERPFSAWLFSIARYKMVDHFRRSRDLRSLADCDDFGIEAFEEASNAAIDVERLLATLPPKQAVAIRHTRIEGRSVAEAAVAAGIGESDVKVSVHRGIRALAARFGGSRK